MKFDLKIDLVVIGLFVAIAVIFTPHLWFVSIGALKTWQFCLVLLGILAVDKRFL